MAAIQRRQKAARRLSTDDIARATGIPVDQLAEALQRQRQEAEQAGQAEGAEEAEGDYWVEAGPQAASEGLPGAAAGGAAAAHSAPAEGAEAKGVSPFAYKLQMLEAQHKELSAEFWKNCVRVEARRCKAKAFHEGMAGVIALLQDRPQIAAIKTSSYSIDFHFKVMTSPKKCVQMIKDAIASKQFSEKAVPIPPFTQEGNFMRQPARLLFRILCNMVVDLREDADDKLPDGYKVATRYPVPESRAPSFSFESKAGVVLLRGEIDMQKQQVHINTLASYQLLDVKVDAITYLTEVSRAWNIAAVYSFSVVQGPLQRSPEWREVREQRRAAR